MSIPFFYINQYESGQTEIVLDEDTSRHVVQVLRMEKGEELNLTDGKGMLLRAGVQDAHRKHCTVRILGKKFHSRNEIKTSVAISLLKNPSRFEWFLEKATELGITEIIPLICARTEKEKFRHDRLQQVLVSAMLQSQQCWLPVLHQPNAWALLFRQEEMVQYKEKYIAHCIEDNKQELVSKLKSPAGSRIILIGPEGDFSPEEVQIALENHFQPVALGNNRLRAETAGVVAATLIRLV